MYRHSLARYASSSEAETVRVHCRVRWRTRPTGLMRGERYVATCYMLHATCYLISVPLDLDHVPAPARNRGTPLSSVSPHSGISRPPSRPSLRPRASSDPEAASRPRTSTQEGKTGLTKVSLANIGRLSRHHYRDPPVHPPGRHVAHARPSI